MSKTIRLVLGDQLNSEHSWFKKTNADVTYVMMEVLSETSYVTHHIQKILGFFAAMRSFADHLGSQGHQVIYIKIDDKDNKQSFEENIRCLIKKHNFVRFQYMLPDEYRLDQQLSRLPSKLNIDCEVSDTEHFLTSRDEVAKFFENKKGFVMESFYRNMRRKHNILMEGNKPLTGKWNYDAENRKKFDEAAPVKKPRRFNHDLTDIYKSIQKMEIKTIGTVDPKLFNWPINRAESLQFLDFFLRNQLKYFGKYQDAMHSEHPFLFHSLLSFALNLKMLNPVEVIEKAIDHWHNSKNEITFAQLEGFVRQIIGWREYMRGIYWAQMPDFEKMNYFNHSNKLPDFYWTDDTKMNCLKNVIGQSLSYAYAHHIQRLMVAGNFALLAGVHPDEVDDWYLGIYIDAIQWVEITNTRGMSQFADGGIVGTKPYASSANYINKMSNYCDGCYYDKGKRYGDRACPFNSLYWDFYDRNRKLLEKNPRVSVMYRTWDKMPNDEKRDILKQADNYKKSINSL